MVALLQRGPARCYRSPGYMVVVYFCACTEMEKIRRGSPAAPRQLPSISTNPQLTGRELFAVATGVPGSPEPISPHPELGHPLGWVSDGSHQKSSLQRGSVGVNLDPKITPGDPTQRLGSPAVSPDYQFSRSNAWPCWDTIKGTESHHPKQTKSRPRHT